MTSSAKRKQNLDKHSKMNYILAKITDKPKFSYIVFSENRRKYWLFTNLVDALHRARVESQEHHSTAVISEPVLEEKEKKYNLRDVFLYFENKAHLIKPATIKETVKSFCDNGWWMNPEVALV